LSGYSSRLTRFERELPAAREANVFDFSIDNRKEGTRLTNTRPRQECGR